MNLLFVYVAVIKRRPATGFFYVHGHDPPPNDVDLNLKGFGPHAIRRRFRPVVRTYQVRMTRVGGEAQRL